MLPHENPQYRDPSSQLPNFVYVRVGNRGPVPVTGMVTVNWAKASTGLAWPTDWQPSVMCCGKPCAGALTPVAIVALPPGGTQVLECPWFPPNPADFSASVCGGLSQQGHLCLLARVETAAPSPFGMTYPEG